MLWSQIKYLFALMRDADLQSKIGTAAGILMSLIGIGGFFATGALYPIPPIIVFVIGIVVTAVFLVSILTVRAVTLEERLTPKFALSFHPEAEGFAKTPIENYELKGGLQALSNPQLSEGYYVRVRAEALSSVAVRSCHAFITKLERETAGGQQGVSMGLKQPVALRRGESFDVHPGVPSPVDFVFSNSLNNTLNVPEAVWPLALKTAFAEPGTYRFTVTITGGDLSLSKTIAVSWGGQWDKMKAREVLG